VGRFLSKHFLCGWEKVGTFAVVKSGNRVVEKQGGNVATYFCTPDLEVIHAVAGNVGAEEFLGEAKWAVDLAARLEGKAKEERFRVVKEAHEKRLQEQAGSWSNGWSSGVVTFRIGSSIPVQAHTSSTVTHLAIHSPIVLGHAVAGSNVELAADKDLLDWSGTIDNRALLSDGGLGYTDLVFLSGTGVDTNVTLTTSNLGWVVGSNDSRIHQQLAERPLPPLQETFRQVFEGILGEAVSDQAVTVIETPGQRCRRIHLGLVTRQAVNR